MPDTRTEMKFGEIGKELKAVSEILATLFPDGQYATIVIHLGKGLPDAMIPFGLAKEKTIPHPPCSS